MTDIFNTVLNMSITGAYIAAGIIMIRLLIRKLPRRYSYMLWLILAVRLLCPVSLSSAVSVFNLIKPETEENQMVYIPREVYFERDIKYLPALREYAPVTDDSYDALPEAAAEDIAPPAAETKSSPREMFGIFSCVWLAGAAGMAIYTAAAYAAVRRRVCRAKLLRENIYVCGGIDSPFVYGLLRPRIYLPDDVPEGETEFILAHENAHISRGDHIIKLIAMAALSLHWFNPLMWVSYRLMIRDMELSCDEKAIRSFDTDVRKSYAETLLNMSMRQNKIVLGGILGFGESNIKTRIKSVLTSKKPTAAVTAAAAVIVLAAAACMLTNSKGALINKSDYGAFAVCADKNGDIADVDPADGYEIIDAVNSGRCRRINAELSERAEDVSCTMRMYSGSERGGEYSSLRIFPAEERGNILCLADNKSERYYSIDAGAGEKLAEKLALHFSGISPDDPLSGDGGYISDDGKYTLNFFIREYVGGAGEPGGNFSLCGEDGGYIAGGYLSSRLGYISLYSDVFDSAAGESTRLSFYCTDGDNLELTAADGSPYGDIPTRFTRKKAGVSVSASADSRYCLRSGSYEIDLPDETGAAIEGVFTEMSHTAMSGNDAYYIYDMPENPRTVYEYDFLIGTKCGDGSYLYKIISFLSPAHYEDYQSDTRGKVFRYIRVMGCRIFADDADKLPEEYENIMSDGSQGEGKPCEITNEYYALTDEEWDSLCRMIPEMFEKFPEGVYVSDRSPERCVIVRREGVKSVFTFCDDGREIALRPDTSADYGLRLTCADGDGSSFAYMGGGRIKADIPAAERLSVPELFVLRKEPSEMAAEAYFRANYYSVNADKECTELIKSRSEAEDFARRYGISDAEEFLFGFTDETMTERCSAAVIMPEKDGARRYTVADISVSDSEAVITMACANPLLDAPDNGAQGCAYIVSLPRSVSSVKVRTKQLPPAVGREESAALAAYLGLYHSLLYDGGVADFGVGAEDIFADEYIRSYTNAAAEYDNRIFVRELRFVNVVPDETRISVSDGADGRRIYRVPYAVEMGALTETGAEYCSGITGYTAAIELVRINGSYKVSKALTGSAADYEAFGRDADITAADFREGAEILRQANEWRNTPHNLTRDNWNTKLSDVTLPDLEPPERINYAFMDKCERVAVVDEKPCGEYCVQLAAEYAFVNSKKDPRKIYCCSAPMLRFVCGGSTEAADFPECDGLPELDGDRLGDYVTVYEMGGDQLIMFRYGGVTSFYRNMHDTPYRNEHGFENFGFRSAGSAASGNMAAERLDISDNISVDCESRTLTDNASGTVYRFNFEDSTFTCG